MRLINLLFFSLLSVVLADSEIWGFTPDEPAGTSPNVNLLVRQQYTCPSGYGLCSNRQSCCPLGGRCCSSGGCCGSGHYCVTGGCCPNGEICTGGVRGCSVSGTYPCQNESFCCPFGDTCYRDSSGTPRCGSGGGDPNPDPTTRTTRTTVQKTSTSTSTRTTSQTSYTTLSYETTLGIVVTYTIVIGQTTTRTAGIAMPTSFSVVSITVPGLTNPTGISMPTALPTGIVSSLLNSNSSTSSRAPTFTAQASSGTINRFPSSISILVAGLCLLALY